MADIQQLLKQHAETTTSAIDSALSKRRHTPPRLMEAIRYSLEAGGKRVRPALALETFAACSADLSSADRDARYPSALAAAVALELIHTFSLVHDDLPAMDNDDLRRGRPTNHKVFGEAMAILAGDGMTTLAFEIIACDAAPTAVPALIRELAHATGPEGMIGGQVLDMEGEGTALSLDQLKQLHRMKTGALLIASCRLGAIAAGASEETVTAMTRYGQHLGLAFQIADDILDVISTPEQMGKATGKDADRGKNTYPVLMGLEESRTQAIIEYRGAIEALQSFGPSADGLREVARYVVERQS